MTFTRMVLLFVALSFSCLNAHANFLDTYPHLEKFLFRERPSHISLGFGVSPFTLFKNKAGFSVSLFQVHYRNGLLNWEVFHGSFGLAIADKPENSIRVFTFRTSPRLKLSNAIAIGPLVGYEFITFPDISARLHNASLFTPSEPFSSRGLIYGLAVTQEFRIGERYSLRAMESVYRQSYSTTSVDGWSFYFDKTGSGFDVGNIAPGTVFALELSFLY